MQDAPNVISEVSLQLPRFGQKFFFSHAYISMCPISEAYETRQFYHQESNKGSIKLRWI